MKEPKNYELNIVEIDCKDQFCSRRDQQNINQFLLETAVYTSKIIFCQGLKLTIALLLNNKGKGEEEIVHTGIITKNTTIVYRSLSSRITLLVDFYIEIKRMLRN